MTIDTEPPPPGVKTMAIVRWVLLAATASLALFMGWSYARAEMRGSSGSARPAAKYHCPMHPQIVSDEPGECPICHMRLEPIAPNGSAPAPGSATAPGGMPGGMPPGTTPITLTLDRIQSIGVRTAVAGDRQAKQPLRVTAIVAPTEQGVAEVHVRSPGFVERLLVDQTGIAVGAQQPLFAFYSPEIFQAESELIAAHRWERADGGMTAAESPRRKLELLGMAGADIDQVVKTREPMRAIPVYAPRAGYVTKKNLVVGSYVSPEMPLYEIQNLSLVYVIADVFQRDIGAIHPGSVGRFVPTRRPGEGIDVRVDLVYPTLDAEARTTRVRMQLKNPKGLALRPGEYGSVELAVPARDVLTVPRDAVIDTGLSTYVFVVLEEGRFSPREVVLGDEQGESIAVLSGLSPGDRVVAGATFLIDAESRLQASAAQAIPAASPEPRAPGP